MQDIEDIVLDSKDNLFDENTWTIICDEFTINSKNIKSNKGKVLRIKYTKVSNVGRRGHCPCQPLL